MLIGAVLTVSGCSWFKKKAPVVKAPVVENVAPAPQGAPPSVEPSGPRPGETRPFAPGMVDTVYFDFDKSTIRHNQMVHLEKNLAYLKEHAGEKVLIEGHCDERGTVEYNFSLGQRRANTVKDYFLKNGIAADRIATVSKGEEEPADPGHNEAAWAKNRRCEFKQMF